MKDFRKQQRYEVKWKIKLIWLKVKLEIPGFCTLSFWESEYEDIEIFQDTIVVTQPNGAIRRIHLKGLGEKVNHDRLSWRRNSPTKSPKSENSTHTEGESPNSRIGIVEKSPVNSFLQPCPTSSKNQPLDSHLISNLIELTNQIQNLNEINLPSSYSPRQALHSLVPEPWTLVKPSTHSTKNSKRSDNPKATSTPTKNLLRRKPPQKASIEVLSPSDNRLNELE